MASNKSLIYQQLNFISLLFERASNETDRFTENCLKQALILQLTVGLEVYFRARGMSAREFKKQISNLSEGTMIGAANAIQSSAASELSSVISNLLWFTELISLSESTRYTKTEWSELKLSRADLHTKSQNIIAVESAEDMRVTGSISSSHPIHWSELSLDKIELYVETFKEYVERQLSQDIES